MNSALIICAATLPSNTSKGADAGTAPRTAFHQLMGAVTSSGTATRQACPQVAPASTGAPFSTYELLNSTAVTGPSTRTPLTQERTTRVELVANSPTSVSGIEETPASIAKESAPAALPTPCACARHKAHKAISKEASPLEKAEGAGAIWTEAKTAAVTPQSASDASCKQPTTSSKQPSCDAVGNATLPFNAHGREGEDPLATQPQPVTLFAEEATSLPLADAVNAVDPTREDGSALSVLPQLTRGTTQSRPAQTASSAASLPRTGTNHENAATREIGMTASEHVSSRPASSSISHMDASSLVTTGSAERTSSTTKRSNIGSEEGTKSTATRSNSSVRTTSESAAQAPTKENTTTSSSQDDTAPIAAEARTHAPAIMQPIGAAITPVHPAVTVDSPSATVQSVAAVATSSGRGELGNHAAPSPAVTEQAQVQEPLHALDAAQLRAHGSVSELKVSVQLPELGRVEVRAISTHEATTAHITTFRHDALPGLAAGRAGLEEALKSHDVTLGSLSSHSQGQPNRQHSQENSFAPAGAAPVGPTDIISAEDEQTSFLPDHASISVRA